MHPLLNVLKLAPLVGESSSVHDLRPIRASAPNASRTLPCMLSLGLTSLLMFGIAQSRFDSSSLQSIQGAVVQAGRSVAVLLAEPVERSGFPPPARNLVGPRAAGGAGHAEGTSTLDPRLARLTTATAMPSEAIDPASLSTLPTADRAFLSLNLALPLQAGGNGLTRGTGRDAALGPGGRFRPATGVAVPDHRLIPIHQVPLFHRLGPGEAVAARQPVRVRLTIGADGVTQRAIALSGPTFLRDEAVKAALQWRFEPLGAHGLEAPLALTLTFYPRFL